MNSGNAWWHRVGQSPEQVRVLPFVLFVLPIYLQGTLGPASPYWVYTLRTVLGVGLLVWMWPRVREMRWVFSWEAVVVGVFVFAVWVGLDPYYPKLKELGQAWGLSQAEANPAPVQTWNPQLVFGANSAAAWFFIGVRILGSTLVVPPLEEVFYRSFLYRFLNRNDFLAAPLSQFYRWPFVVVCLLFGLAHHEWLAGILCGVAYQSLVLYKGRLGDAMTAHAITNGLLGIWVVTQGAWKFW